MKKREIFTIAKFGCLDEFIEAFKPSEINEKNNNGSSLLHLSISGNKFDIALFLINEGIEINILNKDLQSAMHLICINQNIDVAKELISHGASILARDKYGNTPLWTAVFNCKGINYEMVKLLMLNNSDPISKNNNNVSPSDFAHKICDKELIEILNNYNK